MGGFTSAVLSCSCCITGSPNSKQAPTVQYFEMSTMSTEGQVYLEANAACSQNISMDHYAANVITTTVGGGLSMLAALFIIVSHLKLEELRASGTIAEKILLYIITADVISAASSVIGVWTPSCGTSCKAEGFFIIFSTTASFFWTSCLTIHLFLITDNARGTWFDKRKLMITFHMVCWGLPLLLSFVGLVSGVLGPSPTIPTAKKSIKLTTGGWCWIKGDTKTKTIVWTLMTSKFWEIASYLLITVLCWVIFCQLRFQLSSSVDMGQDTLSAVRKVERRMMFIPIAFILLRIWGTVRYFAYVSNLSVRDHVLENIPLYALQGLGDSSQGLANSIFFCLSNKRVYYHWKTVLCNLCYFFCHREDSGSNERTPLIPPRSIRLQKD